MRKTQQFISRLATATFVLGLFATPMLLTSCDDLEKALSQLDELSKEDEPKQSTKSDLPPIGSVVVKNAIDAYEGEEEEEAAEDVMPQFNTAYANEDGAIWTFMLSEENDGQLEATFADPTKKGKVSHFFLEKRGNSAYDVYPKNNDIPVSIGVIRIKDGGVSIEESRGSKKTIFYICE